MKMNKTALCLMFMGAAPMAMAAESQSPTTMDTRTNTNMPNGTTPNAAMDTPMAGTMEQPSTAGMTPSDIAKAADHKAITFDKGSATISNAQRTEIRNLVDQAKANGPLKEVQVGVWADKEFPIQTNTDLPKADRDLADRRGDAIKKFMKDELKISDVTIHNMAKAPGALARAFNTQDAELKSLFARRSADTSKAMPANKEIAEELVLFRDNGKPSTAVIVINHKAM